MRKSDDIVFCLHSIFKFFFFVQRVGVFIYACMYRLTSNMLDYVLREVSNIDNFIVEYFGTSALQICV